VGIGVKWGLLGNARQGTAAQNRAQQSTGSKGWYPYGGGMSFLLGILQNPVKRGIGNSASIRCYVKLGMEVYIWRLEM